MSPYRTSGEQPARAPQPDDDPIILWVALCVSLLGLIPRLVAGSSWGAEPTMALLIAAGSSFLLVRRKVK